MKKTLKSLLIFMLIAVLAVTAFVVPVSAAKSDDSSSVGSIFNDNRFRSYDYRVVCVKVKYPNGTESYASGFIFAKNAIMTVAHLIYDKSCGGFANNITVYPGGLSEKGYSYKRISYDPSIVGLDYSYWDYDDDWAIIETWDNIGDIYGYFGFSANVTTNDNLTITGFPSDKGAKQYTEYGKASFIHLNIIEHFMSSTEGCSGAPTYKTVNGSDIVVGFVIGGNRVCNIARKIDDFLVNKMMEYRQHYHIKYNANGGSGSMEQTTVEYGGKYYLRKNSFKNGSKTFAGWTAYRNSDNKWFYKNPGTGESAWYKENCQPTGWIKYIYSDGAYVSKTSSVNNDTINLYAQWKNFTVKYYPEGGTGSMSDTTVYYGIGTALRNNKFTKSGRHFTGWTAYRRSDKKWCYKNPNTGSPEWYTKNPGGWEKYIYYNQQKTACASSIHNDVIEMHAQWDTPSTFTINYMANGGNGTMNKTTVTYGVTTKLRANTFTNTIKKDGKLLSKQFAGWTAYRASDNKWCYQNPDTGEINWYTENKMPTGWVKFRYSDCASVAKTSSVDNDQINLYAQWKFFTVKYYPEGGTGSMSNTTVYYGIGTALRNNKFTKSGYTFNGWTAYRRSDKKWCYKNPKTGSPEWYTKNPGGWEKYIYHNQQLTACASTIHDDVVEMHAQWLNNKQINSQNIKGDINGDGTLTINDVTQLQRYLVEFESFDEYQMKAADVNNDGEITINDITALQVLLNN